MLKDKQSCSSLYMESHRSSTEGLLVSLLEMTQQTKIPNLSKKSIIR